IWRLSEAANEAQRTNLLYTAHSVAAAADAKLGEYIALGQALARSPALLEDNLDRFEVEARRIFASTPEAIVVVANLQGQQLVNTASQPGQRLPLRSPLARATQNRAYETRSTIISDVHLGALSHEWVIDIEIPIFRDGKYFRSLAVAVRARSF